MKYIHYILSALIVPSIVQASNNKQMIPYKINKNEMRSDCAGIFFAGLWSCSGINKIGRIPLNRVTRAMGTVPCFFVGKKLFHATMDFSHGINKQIIKITQK